MRKFFKSVSFFFFCHFLLTLKTVFLAVIIVLLGFAIAAFAWQNPTSPPPGGNLSLPWIKSGSNVYLTTLSDNVGIGTTTPGYKLDVSGDVRITSSLGLGTIPSGTAGKMSFVGDALIDASQTLGAGQNDLDIYSPDYTVVRGGYRTMLGAAYGSAPVVIEPGTANSLYIDSSGKVGIGATNPTAKLYVRTDDTTIVPFQVEETLIGGFDLNLMPGWNYRRPITITNTGGVLTDYQILVTLDTASLISAGKMRSDCGDIRFTDSDGSTQLSYWVEPGCNTASTKLWVKVPSIPASSNKTIYVYYGNPNASSVSNGDSTFDFFDDFNDGVIGTNKWYVSVSAGSITETNGYLEIVRNGSGVNNIQTSASFGPNFIAEMNGTLISIASGHHIIFGYMNTDRADGNGYWPFYTSGGFYRDHKRTPGVWTYLGSGGSYILGTWQKHKIIRVGTNFKFYVDDVLVFNRTITEVGTNATYIVAPRVWGESPGEVGTVRFDNFRVRKYTSSEPTTSVGSEETPTAQQQTVFYIQNQTGNVGIGTTNPGAKLEVVGTIQATNVVKADGMEVAKIISNSVSYGSVVCDNTYHTLSSYTFSLSGTRMVYIQVKQDGRLNTTGHSYIDMFVDGVRRDSSGVESKYSWRHFNVTSWTGVLEPGDHTIRIDYYCGSGASSLADNISEWPSGGLKYLIIVAQ